VYHSTAIQQLDEGAVQAACSCGWRSPVSGAGKRTGTTGPLQHATEAAALHEWEMSLQLAAPHVRRDVTAVALTAYSGIPDQQHRGPRESHRQVTWPPAIARRKPLPRNVPRCMYQRHYASLRTN